MALSRSAKGSAAQPTDDLNSRVSDTQLMKVEVRATGLKAMREKRGLTQRKLAHDLGISQNYIPAIEANSRQAGPKLQDALVKYFGVRFEDLFEVVLVNSETGHEQVLERRT
jgi:DNA-binding XRE family transcriptional regulator